MGRATLEAVNPVLPVQDVQASIEFYVRRLGFSLLGQDSASNPRYAVVRRDNVVLHVQWHDPAEWDAVERPSLRFVVPALGALFDEYQGTGVLRGKAAIRETPWGTREFGLFDPDQNGLTFYCDRDEV
jgi:catechol 2,3-dioxygenase-like lactoylglutathione lyase family enzyme